MASTEKILRTVPASAPTMDGTDRENAPRPSSPRAGGGSAEPDAEPETTIRVIEVQQQLTDVLGLGPDELRDHLRAAAESLRPENPALADALEGFAAISARGRSPSGEASARAAIGSPDEVMARRVLAGGRFRARAAALRAPEPNAQSAGQTGRGGACPGNGRPAPGKALRVRAEARVEVDFEFSRNRTSTQRRRAAVAAEQPFLLAGFTAAPEIHPLPVAGAPLVPPLPPALRAQLRPSLAPRERAWTASSRHLRELLARQIAAGRFLASAEAWWFIVLAEPAAPGRAGPEKEGSAQSVKAARDKETPPPSEIQQRIRALAAQLLDSFFGGAQEGPGSAAPREDGAPESIMTKIRRVRSAPADAGLADSGSARRKRDATTAAIWGDLMQMHQQETAYMAGLHGLGSPAVAARLERWRLEQEGARAARAQARSLEAEAAEAALLREIARDKLGDARLRELESAAVRKRPFGGAGAGLLAQLGRGERRLVLAEKQQRDRQLALQRANRCPHVALLARLRRAASGREQRRLHRELAAYYSPETAPGKNPKFRGWVRCRECGFSVLCSHADLLLRAQYDNKPFWEVRRALEPWRVLLVKEGEESAPASYCRTCAEQVGSADASVMAAVGRMGALDDELRRLLWIEALKLFPDLRFGVPTDPRRFAAAAAQAAHGALLQLVAASAAWPGAPARAAEPAPGQRPIPGYEDAEAPFQKNKGPRPEAGSWTQMLAAVAVRAYVLALVRRGENRPPAERLGLEGVRPRARLSAYAGALLENLTKRASLAIALASGITPGLLAEALRAAYRQLEGESETVEHEDAAQRFLRNVAGTDPTFGYALRAARAAGCVPPASGFLPLGVEGLSVRAGRAKKKDARQLARPAPLAVVELVFGRTLKDMLSSQQPRIEAAGPEYVAFSAALMMGPVAPLPREDDLLRIYRRPEINLYRGLWELPPRFRQLGRAFLAETLKDALPDGRRGVPLTIGDDRRPALKGGRERAAAKRGRAAGGHKKSPAGRLPKPSPWNRAGTASGQEEGLYFLSYELFRRYTAERDSAERGADIAAAWAEAALAEKRLRRRAHLLGVPPFRAALAGAGHRGGEIKPLPAPVAAVYDEEGRKHRWTRQVYRRIDSRPASRAADGGPRAGEVEYGPGFRDLRGLAFVAYRCAVCGVRSDRTDRLDSARIEAVLQQQAGRQAFFGYFLLRCPEQGVHEYGSGAEGAPTHKVSTRGGAGACRKCGAVFSAAWRSSAEAERYYARYRGRLAEAMRSAREGTPAPRAPPLEALDAERFAAAYEHNPAVWAEAAAAAEVSPIVLEALGASEGENYEELLGRPAPQPPASDGGRLLALRGAVRIFLAEYSALRYAARSESSPALVRRVLGKAWVPADEVRRLPSLLPDLAAGPALGFDRRTGALLRLRGAGAAFRYGIETLGRCVGVLQGLALAPLPGEGGAPQAKKDWLARLGRIFAAEVLKTLSRSESTFAKPGAFSFGLFGGDALPGAADTASDNPDAYGEDGMETTQEIAAAMEDLSSGASKSRADPFSLDAVDMDEDAAVNLE